MNNNNMNHGESSRSTEILDIPQHVHVPQNNAVEATLACQTRLTVEQLRPFNTNHAYLPRQREFQQWCKDTCYPDDFVTELKVVRFVGSIKQRGIVSKKKNEDGTISETRKGYSYESLKQYIKACIDLHNKQKSANQGGGMTFRHPRGEMLKSYESSLKKECTISRVRNYEDPEVGSIQDGYSTEQLVLIANYYLGISRNVCNALRDRMVFLLNHVMMLHGETLRQATLNHLFSLDFKDEGSQHCPGFVMMIASGKTNQENHKPYSGAIRHKNVFTCAFGAVGLYFFYRFHIFGEPFPDFSENKNWFDTKLARGQKPDKSVAYQSQLSSVNKAFAFLNINSKKKTHAGRQAGARDTEMAGLADDHIRRVGRWNDDSIQNNYLDCLPRTAIRVMQGFPETKGCFWLARNLVTPPLSLQKQIFPQIEEWQQKMRENKEMQTICGEGFLGLLIELRPIILQDAVIIRQVFPNNGLFQHSIFLSPEFNAFAERLLLEMESTTPPTEVEIQRFAPFLNEKITELAHRVNTATTSNNDFASLSLAVERLQQSVNALSARLDALTSGEASLRNDGSRVRRREEDEEEALEEGATGGDAHQEKKYRLSRDNITVDALWKEWTVGLNETLPSVNDLNHKYGSSWRQDAKERKFYSTRLVIIKEAHRISEEEGITTEDAIKKLEDKRRSIPGGCSLAKLSRIIRNNQ